MYDVARNDYIVDGLGLEGSPGMKLDDDQRTVQAWRVQRLLSSSKLKITLCCPVPDGFAERETAIAAAVELKRR